MKNKILSLILVIALMLPFGVVDAAISSDNLPELMTALDFIPSAESATDVEITRGEFAILATKLINISNIENIGEPSKFSDVPVNHPSYHSVTLLKNMGVIHGETNTEFNPDEPILLADACKIIIHIMGYEHLVVNGNYLTVAANKKLLNGISVEGKTMSVKTALKLIYNTLEADISDYNRFDGNSSGDYYETFMSKRLGIYKISGLVSDDGNISLTGDSHIKENQVKVGSYVFENETGNSDLLGYTIDGFYKLDDVTDKYVLLYAYVKEYDNSVIVINSDNIIGYQDYTYEYYPDETKDDSEEINIAPSYKLIYNGRIYKAETAAPSFTLTVNDMMKPKFGSVKLTDVDADGEYDIVSVLDYKNYFVASVDFDTYTIYGNTKYTPGVLPLGEASHNMNVTSASGIKTEFTKILADNVVSVGISADGKHAEIVISANKIETYIQYMDTEGYISDDVVYKFSPEFETYMATNNKPEVGDNAILYLAFDGSVVCAKMAGESDVYYACLLGFSSTRGLNKKVSLKLYTQNNDWAYYDLADKVYVDGNKYTDHEDIYYYLAEVNDFTVTGEYSGIILVKFNSKDEVNYIDTPYKASVGNPNYLTENDNSLHVMENGQKQVVRFKREAYAFEGFYRATQNSTYIIMGDRAEKPENDIIFTTLSDTSSVSDMNNNFCEVMAFSTTANSFIADAIVRYMPHTFGSVSDNIQYHVVLKVANAINKAGELVKKVTVTNGKVIKDYYTESEDTLICKCGSTHCSVTPIVVSVGDIVKFKLNSQNVILDDCIFVAYDYDTNTQWAYVKESSHEGTAANPTKQNAYGSEFSRYAVLYGYLDSMQGETGKWIFDFIPYYTSDTYRGTVVRRGPYYNDINNITMPWIYSMQEAYVIDVNVSTGKVKNRLVSELKQYNNGNGVLKKYFVLSSQNMPYCVINYIQ